MRALYNVVLAVRNCQPYLYLTTGVMCVRNEVVFGDFD